MFPRKTDSKLVKIWKTIRFVCIALILLAISTAFLYTIVAGIASLLTEPEGLNFGIITGILVIWYLMFTAPYCFFVWGILLFLILMIIAASIGIDLTKGKKTTLKVLAIIGIVIGVWFSFTATRAYIKVIVKDSVDTYKDKTGVKYSVRDFKNELESRGFLVDTGMLFCLDGKDEKQFWQISLEEDLAQTHPAFLYVMTPGWEWKGSKDWATYGNGSEKVYLFVYYIKGQVYVEPKEISIYGLGPSFLSRDTIYSEEDKIWVYEADEHEYYHLSQEDGISTFQTYYYHGIDWPKYHLIDEREAQYCVDADYSTEFDLTEKSPLSEFSEWACVHVEIVDKVDLNHIKQKMQDDIEE